MRGWKNRPDVKFSFFFFSLWSACDALHNGKESRGPKTSFAGVIDLVIEGICVLHSVGTTTPFIFASSYQPSFRTGVDSGFLFSYQHSFLVIFTLGLALRLLFLCHVFTRLGVITQSHAAGSLFVTGGYFTPMYNLYSFITHGS